MKNLSLSKHPSLAWFPAALFILFCASLSMAQPVSCPPGNEGTLNPEPTFCQVPSGPFDILLILDESGSINSPVIFEDDIERAVTDFSTALNSLVPSAGKFRMGIVEFSTNASTPLGQTDVKSPGFLGAVSNYLNGDGGPNPNYNPSNPSALTNFEAALLEAKKINGLDFVFFITDGNPTAGAGITVWRQLANDLKGAKTYVFGIALGNSVDYCNVRALSGPDELNQPLSFSDGADWTRTNFDQLGNDLVSFATSLIDTKPPTITCPGDVRNNNDAGICGKVLNYLTTATDDCTVKNMVCTPPPGSLFNVGQTIVQCKAEDNAGNSSTCLFKVTILDMEAPKITCPANKLISCEASTLPANTGSPITSDNCSVGGVASVDVRIDGACANEFTLQRSWTVADIHGNLSSCLQVISVEDKKVPLITCPANITVTCDTTVSKTGMATATDNCDESVELRRRDIHISGDCDWFCVTERHWNATDNCGNTSKCVQVITKDVTPLIENALAAGPIKWGQNAATVTLPPGRGACVVQWLPYSGVVPTALKFDDAVAGPTCSLMTNPLDGGHIVNPLLGEAMKLKILVRLNPALGTTKLSAIPCEMHFIVKQALAPNPDVNELLRVTDLTLGNVNVNLLVPEHAMHLLNVLKCVNAGRSVCNP